MQPIVLCGAEIWGVDHSSYMIEKLHLFAMKKMLGVGMRTLNDLINVDLGRFQSTSMLKSAVSVIGWNWHEWVNIGFLLKHTESCVIWMREVKQIGFLMYIAF